MNYTKQVSIIHVIIAFIGNDNFSKYLSFVYIKRTKHKSF